MRLDEDDFYDGEDSYDEDADIEFVLNAVSGTTQAEVEAELEKADWDVDVAIASLKRRMANRPKTAPPAPKAEPEAPKKTTVETTKGKLTPLQMLALKRASKSSIKVGTDSDPKSGDIKLSLAELAAQRKAQRQNDNSTTLITGFPRFVGSNPGANTHSDLATNLSQHEPKSAGSALDRLRQRRFSKEDEKFSPSAAALPPQSPKVKEVASWQPQIDYALPRAAAERCPSGFGSVIANTTHIVPRTATNFLDTASSASSAFSQPSPDDVVLNAQSSAFKTKPITKPATSQTAKAESHILEVPRTKQSPTLASRLASLKLKPSCAFVVIGHVDAGKSTLMGRLLLDSGAIPAKTIAKFEHESTKAGKSSFWLAWALDATAEERERGVTVDIGEARFETTKTRFTVLDAPGHRDYIPNMIAGVSQADLAVLVVDADTNAFESGFALDGQTKEHAILARSLGLSTIVVAVNKMDTQQWDESRFAEITELLTDFLTKKVGFTADQCIFVPTSGISGTNVVKPVVASSSDGAKLSAWYKGPTLVGALDKFAEERSENRRRTDDTLRFAVTNSFVEPFQSVTTLSGRVLSGGLEAGDVFEVAQPFNVGGRVTVTVKTVPGEYLVAGDIGEIKVDFDTSRGIQIHPGDVLTGADGGLQAVTNFTAKIRLFDVPKPVLPGSKLAFHMGRIEDTVKVVKIVEALAIGGKNAAPARKLRHLSRGSAAVVELELSQPIVLALPAVCKDLGRFVLRLNGSTIGGGVVSELTT